MELQLGLFKGFYGSWFESELDNFVSEDLREMGKDYDDVNISYDLTAYAKDIFEFAKYEYLPELDFLSKCEFKELSSPNYYNYSNDKIYFDCEIDANGFIDWATNLLTENNDISEMVKESIIDAHTSCSGFTSFHSNKISDWIKDLVEFDLDNNKTVYKIGFIISSYIENKNKFDDYNWNFESDYFENSDRCGLYEAYSIEA